MLLKLANNSPGEGLADPVPVLISSLFPELIWSGIEPVTFHT